MTLPFPLMPGAAAVVTGEASGIGLAIVRYLVERVAADDFYIRCSDNEVDRPTDEAHIRSPWHPDHAAAFARHMRAKVRPRG